MSAIIEKYFSSRGALLTPVSAVPAAMLTVHAALQRLAVSLVPHHLPDNQSYHTA